MTFADLPLLQPDWPAPASVGSAMSTRAGGTGSGPYGSFNLRPQAVAGQDPPDAAEAANQMRWRAALGARPVWLRQVHGAAVATVTGTEADGQVVADAAITNRPGVACTVLVADCLPVLFCDREGAWVGAAHAGWRGLASGVLERTVDALVTVNRGHPGGLLAWLGPCIGPEVFEVGAEVPQAFGVAGGDSGRFRWSPRPDGSPRWRADLAGLAEDRLRACGVGSVTVQSACTVSDPLRFFSFRRDGLTGRMAAAVWLR